jgi:prepilin-type N-terminal cleavage/methylation domain-containing protein
MMKLSSFLKHLKSGKGLTLLEVMVGMVILAFGILGLAPIIVISMFGNSYSNEVTTANAIAQEKVEQLKEVANFSPIPWSEVVSGVRGKFTRTTTIDDNTSDASVPLNVYRIKVNINWTDQKGLNRNVNYYTYKSKK